jgi:hypothetical protein
MMAAIMKIGIGFMDHPLGASVVRCCSSWAMVPSLMFVGRRARSARLDSSQIG